MGFEPNVFGFSGPAKKYILTALKENIGLLKLGTIEKINALILEVGQGYLKKKTKKQFALKPTVML
jgi:hypothetical protein